MWSSNFLGNHSVTKIASQNTPVQMPLPSLRGSSFIGKRYILVLNQKGVTPPLPPTNSWFYSTRFSFLYYGLDVCISYKLSLNYSYFCVCECRCEGMLVFAFSLLIYVLSCKTSTGTDGNVKRNKILTPKPSTYVLVIHYWIHNKKYRSTRCWSFV